MLENTAKEPFRVDKLCPSSGKFTSRQTHQGNSTVRKWGAEGSFLRSDIVRARTCHTFFLWCHCVHCFEEAMMRS